MNAIVAKVSAATLVAASLLSGCGDSTTSPLTPAQVQLETVLLHQTSGRLPALQRSNGLAAAISASAVIGPAGGTLALPAAGVTVTFPAGAVAAPTTIRITAPAGRNVGYDFAPHGLTFAQPVRVSQSLANTEAAGNASLRTSLLGAYVPDGVSSIKENVPTWVTELRVIDVDPAGTTASYNIQHFSGYITASGRRPASE